MKAVLSIGSNMDDRWSLLRTVIKEFDSDLIADSPVYATPPWGVTDQPDFLNATLLIDVDSTPYELLHRCQGLEQAADRRRIKHWGPRTLDVDIIQVRHGETEVENDDPTLILPHPHAFERAFVLLPWLDIEPEATLRGVPVREYIEKLRTSDTEAETFKLITRVGTLAGGPA